MILVDLSAIMVSNLMVQVGYKQRGEINEDAVRHMVLDSLRGHRSKFKEKYGELVICCDHKNTWRRHVFPYYKASRRTTKKKSPVDWKRAYQVFDTIRQELEEFFPYNVIHVEWAEGDDVIASIAHHEGKMFGGNPQLIISRDKDFIQLQKYANVEQYDPIGKHWVANEDPERYLIEHIIRGDKDDGVPSVLSPDDKFVIPGPRSPKLTAKRIQEIIDGALDDPNLAKRMERNRMLIDLEQTPPAIVKKIIDKYQQDPGDRSKLFDYFYSRNLTNLLPTINEF